MEDADDKTSAADELPRLEMENMIGFNGLVHNGLLVHPRRHHLLYPVGSSVVVENIESGKQQFLGGHSNTISCVGVSKSGKYVASGQVTTLGFTTDVRVYDFDAMKCHGRLHLHQSKVLAVAFSHNDKYLLTLGGHDDEKLVLWNVIDNHPMSCAAAQPKQVGLTFVLAWANKSDTMAVTAGGECVRIWIIGADDRKLYPENVKMGHLTRVIRSIAFDCNDEYVYCGTTTGDIMSVNVKHRLVRASGPPEKERFSGGVTCLMTSPKIANQLIVGTGEGIVCLICGVPNKFTKSRQVAVGGAVTSISVRGDGHQFYVGTTLCNIYQFRFDDFTHVLVSTAHTACINDVMFAPRCSDLLATCGGSDARLWHVSRSTELLRIVVPNMTCHAVVIPADGKSIVTGWDDGRIRGYYPETGRPMYVVDNAYGGRVTTLVAFNDCSHVVSGSHLGVVAVWRVPTSGELSACRGVMHVSDHNQYKGHRAPIACLRMRSNDTDVISAGLDGQCIIWDLARRVRRVAFRANTLFRGVSYHPCEYQVVTVGSDRKLSYWETYDGTCVRSLDVTSVGSVNCVDVSSDGENIVTGGDDMLIKMWSYEEGEVICVGVGHCAPVTGIRISSDNKWIISVSSDGAIVRWTYPPVCDVKCKEPKPEPDKNTLDDSCDVTS